MTRESLDITKPAETCVKHELDGVNDGVVGVYSCSRPCLEYIINLPCFPISSQKQDPVGWSHVPIQTHPHTLMRSCMHSRV